MDAVVLAGGRVSADDPLYADSPYGQRCLIDIHGKPMIQWVVDAFSTSEAVDEMIIVGLPSGYRLNINKPFSLLPDTGDMFTNIRKGVSYSAENKPGHARCFIASGDIPALQTEMIDWLAAWIAKNPGSMIYYNVISQSVMEAKFPNAHRSFVRFKDVAVCGGDLNVVDSRFFNQECPIWTRLTQARKHPLRQAAMLGLDTLILVALRMITLEKAVSMVCKRLSLDGTAVVSPYAEMGMDADKPHQLEILRQYLARRL